MGFTNFQWMSKKVLDIGLMPRYQGPSRRIWSKLGIFRSVGDDYIDYSGVLRSPDQDFIDNSGTLRSADEGFIDGNSIYRGG